MTQYPSIEADELVTKQFLRAELAEVRKEIGDVRAEIALAKADLTVRIGVAFAASTTVLGAIGLLR